MDRGAPQRQTVSMTGIVNRLTRIPLLSGLIRNKILLAVVMTVTATFLIILMNACAKMASPYHSIAEIVFYRNLTAIGLVLGFIVLTRRWSAFRTARPWAHAGRSVIGNIGLGMVFWAYSLMPMADVSALLFASPLIVTALSALVLRERVGPWRWGAVLAGFTGVTLISLEQIGHGTALTGHPGLAHFGVAIGLTAAFCMALVSILLRSLGKTEDAFTTVFYFLLVGIAGSGLFVMVDGHWPHPQAFLPLAASGLAGGLSLLIKTQAYKYAEASLLSPYTYTSILWATLLGWIFWGDLPTVTVLAGAAIVIVSNLFILYREQRQKKPA